MHSKYIRIQLVLAWGCLLLGIIIYLFFRSREHLGFVLLDYMGLKSVVDAARSLVAGVVLPDFICCCLPDGLWAGSYILFSDYCNRKERMKTRLMYASVIPMLGVVSELLQFTSLMPGVYDIRDLVCYILPFLIYIEILISNRNENISIN